MKILFISIVFGAALLHAQNDSKEFLFHKKWISMGNTWEERWENTLEGVDSEPLPERFEILGKAARLNEQSILQPATERQLRFSNLAVQKLTAIPGHAEYFGEKAWKLYRTYQGGYEEGKGAFYYPVYQKDGGEALRTLSLLPSVETVGVLGKMLEEDWEQPGFEAAEERGDIPHTFGMRALSAFSRMPIANPPSKPVRHTTWIRDNIGTWRDWYAEIESGRRTFRFIGDPVEYDLRGPVRRGGMDDRSRGTKKPGGVPEGKVLPARTEQGQKDYLPYVFGGLFLLAGIIIYLRGKRNAV